MRIDTHPFLNGLYAVELESLDLDIELALNPFTPIEKHFLEYENICGYIENRRQYEATATAQFFALKSFGINAFIRFLHLDEAAVLTKNYNQCFDKEKLSRTIVITASKDGYTNEPKFFYAILSSENFKFLLKFSAKQKSKIAEVLGTLNYQDLEISESFFLDSQEFQNFRNQVLKFKTAENYFEYLRGQNDL